MTKTLTLSLLAAVWVQPLVAASTNRVWTTVDAAKAEDPDFLIQGEYGSEKDKKGAQVVALGSGAFDVYILDGGLPGEGWDKSKGRLKLTGKTDGERVSFTGEGGSAEIKGGKISVVQGDKSFVLARVQRESVTLNKKAPKGAVVLFDGSDVDSWSGGKMDGGFLLHGTTSKETFQSYHLHLEFMTPYRPYDRGQRRGNSGVYHQGRFETQVLDSFGLEGKMNEAGGIYSIAAPILNMCYPPLRWQTYDVDLTSAVYTDGVLKTHPTLTVKLNGVLIHDAVELTHKTTAAPVKVGPQPGPIYLQNHGNPVFYKNIWVVKK